MSPKYRTEIVRNDSWFSTLDEQIQKSSQRLGAEGWQVSGIQRISENEARITYAKDDGASSGEGCFLTTACEVVLGEQFRDDGVELQTLREHRDRIATARPELHEVVAEYYEYAPQIVTEINASTDSGEVYRRIFDEMVTPTNALLAAGDDDAALACYYQGFRQLRTTYAV
ncbi:hypothetical protein [uncultured Corynebacterium sp.]|uniref:hypothetical protein n=1 Tax=uncultured Corynebacterium sp. TaxID=159447 RepID=UPI0025F9F94D|nr:hypothetical protein [uncultured Corynebacterium sp.]